MNAVYEKSGDVLKPLLISKCNAYWFIIISLCLWLILSSVAATLTIAIAGNRTEQIKAAFILNIARFTQWPDTVFASINAPIKLCLFGDDYLGDALDSIRSKGIGKRKLDIQIVSTVTKDCHILFISHEQMTWFDEQIGTLKRIGLLIIGDHTDTSILEYTPLGEVVSLIRDGNRITFEIDLDAAKAANLQLSSELLKLGRVVRGKR